MYTSRNLVEGFCSWARWDLHGRMTEPYAVQRELLNVPGSVNDGRMEWDDGNGRAAPVRDGMSWMMGNGGERSTACFHFLGLFELLRCASFFFANAAHKEVSCYATVRS